MCKRISLTPLTAEELAFAEENHQVVQWCIRVQNIEEELMDVAYIGYLHAVKKWFARPDLSHWSFRTIAKQTIRSHISNEKQKQNRRIKTVSLEDIIPGTDHLTYGNTVTKENVRFLYREEISMEAVKRRIQFDAPIPEIAKISRNKNASIEIETLMEFLASAHKTMCIEYEDKKEAAKRAANFRSWKKNHKRDDFNVYKFEEKVYIEKVMKRGKK